MTADFGYPLTLIRGADQAALGSRGNKRLSARGAVAPDRMPTRLGGASHERCCRTGRVEAWCTWSSWSWLPPRRSFVWGCSNAGNKPRWTLSRVSHPHSKPWLRRHGRRGGSESATQAVGSACRSRGEVRCSGGSLRIDPMRARQRCTAGAMHEWQRAVVVQRRQPHAEERLHRRQRAVEPQRRHLPDDGLFETVRSDFQMRGPQRDPVITGHLGRSPSRPAAHPAVPAPSATRVSSARPRHLRQWRVI